MKRLGLLILAVLLAGLGLVMSQATQQDNSEEELREVIDYIYGDTVTIAAFPPEMTLELPIPENSHIVASTVHEHQNDTDSTESKYISILMRSENILPSAIGEFYRSYFLQNNWQELRFDYEQSTGFYGSNTVNGAYCYEREYLMYYNVWTNPAEETPTLDWDITLITHPSNAECQIVDNDYVQLTDFFPQFERIEGAEMLDYASMGAMHFPQISATYVVGLRLSIPPSDVFDAYNAQLSDAGWIEQSRQVEESFAISDWLVDGGALGELSGRLVILQKAAGSDEYTAYLSLEQ